jgi:hypothetical protein
MIQKINFVIDYFYTIYKKECEGSSFMFYKVFPLFIFFIFFSVFGFFLTGIYYFTTLFFEVDYLIFILINISLTLTYPFVRIFHPGYKTKEEVLKYSKFKIRFIHYSSFLISFLFWYLYMEVISLIMYHKYI